MHSTSSKEILVKDLSFSKQISISIDNQANNRSINQKVSSKKLLTLEKQKTMLEEIEDQMEREENEQIRKRQQHKAMFESFKKLFDG